MSASLVRGALAFLMPGGPIVIAMALTAANKDLAQWLTVLQGIYPYAALAAALLLGWRFERSRLVFAALIIAAGAWVLGYYAGDGARGGLLFDIVALLLPLNIAVIALLKERGIFTWHGLTRWAWLIAQAVIVIGLFHFQRLDWLTLPATPLIPALEARYLGLAQPALAAYLLALLITAALALIQRNAMESGLFWALALTLFTLTRGQDAALSSVLFATAIVILIIALIEFSHFMAYRDELTALPGRRALNQALLKLGRRYTIAMLDVDHFKRFNDSYGHDVGDEVLKMVAAKMAAVKGRGKSYRYGGEEFTVVFPGKRIEDALPHLERLREDIAEAGFTVRSKNRPKQKDTGKRKSQTGKTLNKKDPGKKTLSRKTLTGRKQVSITISIGVAEAQDNRRDPKAVIKAADKALYRAKKAGRNRVAR